MSLISHEPPDDFADGSSISQAGFLIALKIVGTILAAITALLVLSYFASAWFNLDFDATYWIAAGAILLALTLIRPWWFWSHPKALVVRSLLTDTGAVLLYLVITGSVILTGVRRQLAITRTRNECIRLLAVAHNAHDRIRVLYGNGATNLPHNDTEPRAYSCERLLESK